LRTKLLETVNIQNWQIVVQLSLSIAKINRHDFPESWENFFPFMLHTIQNGSEMHRERVIFIIGQFVKEQVGKKMGNSIEAFRELTEKSFGLMCQFWHYYVNQIIEVMSTGVNNNPTFSLIIKNSLNMAKVIRRMLVGGITNLEENRDALTILSLILKTLIKLYEYRQECEKSDTSNPLIEDINKCLASFIKVALRTQNNHLLQMRSLLIPYLQFCLQVILNCNLKSTNPSDAFMYRILTFMKNVAESQKYNGESEIAKEAKMLVKVQFFNEHVLATIITNLISRYTLLSEEELSQWEEDPELFIKDQDIDYDGSLKNAAELLYISLLETFDEILSSFIASYASNVLKETANSLDQNKILLRDSIYNAMGWGSHYLFQHIDFSTYFKQVLKSEIYINEPGYKIIRRRAVWLIGRWAEHIDDSIIGDVFKCLLFALQDKDTVLKLSALLSLKALLDEDREISKNTFREFLDPFIKNVFQLLYQVEEEETKLSLLNLLIIFIEKMHNDIVPYTSTIMQYLPAIWNQAQEECMVKNAIIIAFTKLVNTLGEHSTSIHSFLLPLISYTTDISNEDTLYYMEDSLELWKTVMQQTPTINDNILNLFPNIPKMLSASFEYVIPALKLIESYILLGKAQFLEKYIQKLNQIFLNIIGEVKDKPMLICLDVIDTILALFPDHAPKCLKDPLQKLMHMLLAGNTSPIIKSNISYIFARIIATDSTKSFYSLLAETNQHISNTNPSDIYSQFLEIWIGYSDHIISAFKRKASALGLLSLLPTQHHSILHFFPSIVNICLQVLYEIDEPISEIVKNFDYETDATEKDEYDRKRLQMQNDRVMLIDMQQMMIQKLDEMERLMGKQAFDHYLKSNVDPQVLIQLVQWRQKLQS